MLFPPVQIIGLIVLVVAFSLFIIWGISNPKYWLWMVPLLAWLFHGMVFYAATIYFNYRGLFNPNIMTFTDWSSIVRLQGYLAMLMYGVALLIYYPGERRNGQPSTDTQ